jgi:hypothetical protein
VIFPDFFLFDRNCSYSTASSYNAGCSYLSDGRILQKNEGTLQSAWGGYAYNSGTNELIGIAGSALPSGAYLDGSATKVGSAAAPNYIYDYNGNLVCDLSKKMIIEYDWRNMPVKFYLYSSMTGTFVHWSDVQTFAAANKSLVTSTIVMTYDASGNRFISQKDNQKWLLME